MGQHHPDRRHPSRQSAPPRPVNPAGLSPAALATAQAATRALLAVESPREAVDVVLGLVTALGGTVTPARTAAADTLPLDLSFGVGEPLLAYADPAGVPRMQLEILLPTFLEDTRQVVMNLRDTAHLDGEASTDELTGLLNRRAWNRQVHRLGRGDTIVMMTLGRIEQGTYPVGSTTDDDVLASFGRLLRQFLAAEDLAARYSRHELVMGVVGTTPHLLAPRLGQLRRIWEAVRPQPVTFHAAVTAIATTPGDAVGEAGNALGTAVATIPHGTRSVR